MALKYILKCSIICKYFTGLVQDENNNPIPGAIIHIVGINHTVKTTNRGEYWRLLLPGVYTISASAPG